MMRIAYSLFFFLFALNLFAQGDLGPVQDYFKISKIEFEGLKRIEVDTVLDKMSLREGMEFDNYVLKRDIENLYKSKYFDYVEAQGLDGNVLKFSFKERPVVAKLSFTGNSEIDEDELKNQVKNKVFNILDVATVNSDVSTLQKFYQDKGFYLASITYNIHALDDTSVELEFKIIENRKIKVKSITFLGNSEVEDSELKKYMETREESFFSFLSGSGNFKEGGFTIDVEKLKLYYASLGFLEAVIGTPQVTISEDKRWVFITIQINEGRKYYVRNVTFSGDLLFSTAEMLEKMTMKSDEPYSELKLQADLLSLTEMYQDEGYAFANISRDLLILEDEEEKAPDGNPKVDIAFSFEKGKLAYFGKISIKGNSKTRDKVIRRELKIFEGQQYSGSNLRISKENVIKLGFFNPEAVSFTTSVSRPFDDVLDVDIIVEERSTGQITLGAGYSTSTGAFLQASISQNNFLGKGQSLAFSLSLSNRDQNFNIGLTEPYLFDSQWTAGADIFKIKNSSSSLYTYETKGFDLRVGHPIFDYTRLFLTYRYATTDISSVNQDLLDDGVIKLSEENGLASSVSISLVHDRRNNNFEPTGGYYTSISSEFVGLGGDKKWFKTDFDARYYKKLFGELVFKTRLQLGRIFRVDGHPVPRTERYFLGGDTKMRGYGHEDIGGELIDTAGKTRHTKGGLFSILNIMELEHPLAQEAGLKWAIFTDIGNVYDKYIGKNGDYSLKANYGIGLRWFLPIGVMRFELAYPINPEKGQEGSQFHFALGQLF